MKKEVSSPALLTLPSLKEGTFLSRPNRFTVRALIDGNEENAHLHDPGRLTELLTEGNRLLLRAAPGEKRKTAWDVIAAFASGRWVIINSSLHRPLGENFLKGPDSPLGKILSLKPEVRISAGRLDFCAETLSGRVWIETKGCTLFEGPRALFPDAPTSRGTRHLRELISLRHRGERAALLIFIFSVSVTRFSPHRERDKDFADTFDEALEQGVEVYPLSFDFDGTQLSYHGLIPVES
ncbi:DNA/RNA nuclease SfsA [Candidatus Mcinerneyibacteriota bacterium]|nr:DNA/RNA nuclease SfsA [Candidatus Mcinerneyibacteriota bacterium]